MGVDVHVGDGHAGVKVGGWEDGHARVCVHVGDGHVGVGRWACGGGRMGM